MSVTNTQDTERALIGSLLSDKVHRAYLLDITTQDMFVNLGHVYAEIERQYREFGKFDERSIEAKIGSQGGLLLDCQMEAVYDEDRITLYVNLLEEQRAYRLLEQGAMRLLSDAKSQSKTIDELRTSVEQLIKQDHGNIRSLTPSQILDREATAPKKEKLETGVLKLDNDMFKDVGMHKGDVTVVMADSGHGKTQFAQWLVSLLLKRYRGAWFQLEDYDVNTASFMLTVTPQYADNLSICDTISDVDDMKAECRRLKQFNDGALDFVVIDYAQIIKCRESESKTLAMEYVTGVLKDIAKDLNIVVIVTSQVTIDSERYNWKRFPRPDDAKWARAIKEMAHCMVSVFRPNAIQGLVTKNMDSLWIKDWEDKLQDYRSVYARVVKRRRGALDHNVLHLVHADDKGLQLPSIGF